MLQGSSDSNFGDVEHILVLAENTIGGATATAPNGAEDTLGRRDPVPQ
jgi:hypothetical protein